MLTNMGDGIEDPKKEERRTVKVQIINEGEAVIKGLALEELIKMLERLDVDVQIEVKSTP